MQMLNRAIEDAADFTEMKRKLLEGHEPRIAELEKRGAHERLDERKLTIASAPQLPPKRPGENRRDYRARVIAAQKAST